MPHKVVIFDFDGTIADTFEIVIKLLNNLSYKYHYGRIEDPEEIRKLKSLGAKELFTKFHISKLKLLFLLRRVKKELQDEIPHVQAFNGISELLRDLKNQGYTTGIISSNSTYNVNLFLKNNNLKDFDYVLADVGIFGKGRKLKKLNKRYRDSVIYYVGDELRDIEAAKKGKTEIISVSWGYNSREALEKANPSMVVNHPYEILSKLQKTA